MAELTCKKCEHRKPRLSANGTYHRYITHKCKLLKRDVNREHYLNIAPQDCPLRKGEENGEK